MKKLLLLLVLVGVPSFSNAQVIGDVEITGSNPYTINADVDYDEFEDVGSYFCLVIDNDLSEIQYGSVIEPFNVGLNSITDTFTINPLTSILYVEFQPLDNNITCDDSFAGSQGGQVFFAPFGDEPEEVNGFQTVIDNANNGFTNTVGFSGGSAVSWMGGNLLMSGIGVAMAVLYELRMWIFAIILISLVIFFSYRSFRFYRH